MSDWELQELQETNERLRRQLQKMGVDEGQTRREAVDAMAQRDRAQRNAIAVLQDCESRGRATIVEWEDDKRRCAASAALPARVSGGATVVPHHGRTRSRSMTGGGVSPAPAAGGGVASANAKKFDGTLGAPAPRKGTGGGSGVLSIAVALPVEPSLDDGGCGGPAYMDDAGASPSDDDDYSSESEAVRNGNVVVSPHVSKPGGGKRRPACSISNPNAFGDAIGGPKNKNWYMCEALRQAIVSHATADHNRVVARTQLVPAASSPTRDDDSDTPPESLQGSIALSEAAQNSVGGPTDPVAAKRQTGLRGLLPNRVAAALRRNNSAPTQQGASEEAYHCFISQNRVTCKRGTDDIGALPPASADITSDILRARFGFDEQPTAAAAAGASPPPATTAAAASRRGTSGKELRGDEISVVFHCENHMRRIRSALEIATDFVTESCGGRASHWRVVHSPGKSDSMFLYFGHLVAKSVNDQEFRLLSTEYLADLAPYVERCPHTLLPRFSMLFTLTWLKTKRSTHFVVMDNVFRTSCFIQKIYDLKGSTVGRDGIDASTGMVTKRTPFGALLLKDNDLPERLIICGPMRRALLVAQLRSDTGFLQKHNIVDYSLLVGQRSRAIVSGSGQVGVRHARTMSSPAGVEAASDTPSFDPSENIDGRCFRAHDGGMVSLPLHTSDKVGEAREDTFYMGLVDVLQPYSGVKRLETMAKSIFYDPNKISVVPPSEFATRLCVLIERISV